MLAGSRDNQNERREDQHDSDVGNTEKGSASKAKSAAQNISETTQKQSSAQSSVQTEGTATSKEAKEKESKRSERFWTCHKSCETPGPWKMADEKCIGCEHIRCGECKIETYEIDDTPDLPHPS